MLRWRAKPDDEVDEDEFDPDRPPPWDRVKWWGWPIRWMWILYDAAQATRASRSLGAGAVEVEDPMTEIETAEEVTIGVD